MERLAAQGFTGVVVAAPTGVAADNVGFGARTLHDLFKLHKVNPTSGTLLPLQGEDQSALKKAFDGVGLLVIDEVSMVSRDMLAQISERLQELRRLRGEEAWAKRLFGGMSVVLAGDFGQLPPVGKAATHTLLHEGVVPGACKERMLVNAGLRAFQEFKTVIRLRRVHRIKGASLYRESLLRLRDGAMTKGDVLVWRSHDLAGPGISEAERASLTPAERKYVEANELSLRDRSYLQNEVPHLFAENAGAGRFNADRAGELAQRGGLRVLRVESRDSCASASKLEFGQYNGLRRVVHLVEGARVMLVKNYRTDAGLVNGSMGTYRGAVLKGGEGEEGHGQVALGRKVYAQTRGAVMA